MKPLPALMLLVSLHASNLLLSQNHCDTTRINVALSHAGQLLDEGQIQKALDIVMPLVEGMALCTVSDSSFKERVWQTAADYYKIGAIEFLYRGMTNQSIDFSERGIALYRLIPGGNPEQLANIYMHLSSAQTLNENRKLAIEYALTGLEIRQKAFPLSPKNSAFYDRIVVNFLALGDIESARFYLDEWEVFHRRIGNKAPLQTRVGLACNWALYYYEKGDEEQAIQILEDTLSQYGELLRAKGVMAGAIVGIAEFNLCEYYSIIENYEKALHYAEKNVALFELRLEKQRGKLLGRSHYAWCLAQSARAAWGLYRQTQDTIWYNMAEQRSKQAEDIIFAMRDRAPNDGFSDWMGDDIDIVANIVEVRQGMYAKTGNVQYMERAFEAVEASKAFAMQEFLHETFALRWGNVPDSLYQKETSYRQEINDLETSFFMIRSQPNADSLIAANDQQLFALRSQYNVLLNDLENQYPEYFRLKYSQPAVSLLQVQQQSLHPGQCLLDLYIRNGQVFALLIRPDTMLWYATPYDSLSHQAVEYVKLESQQFTEYQNLPEGEYLRRLQSFADASHQAYKVLFEPLRPMLLEEVLLIPRNDLAVLPFGALLTRKESNMGRPFQWHFLDKELVISQAFSVGLFNFVQNRPMGKKPSGSVLAVAPSFESKDFGKIHLPVGDIVALTRRDIFKPLPNSGEEAKVIAQLVDGQALLGVDATKANFLQRSPEFNILHLATHSAANDVLGEYSFVALQAESDTQKIDMLYARDIYGLRLSADLVVLSACETALGQFRNGDGIIGLVRAFTCAGARNVVASMWSVNDASTKTLMILFYKEIKKGVSYNRALANAKRVFVQENRQFAHPYYWAGFVLNGR